MIRALRMLDRAAAALPMACVWLYRLLLAPLLPPACRFEPSCSAYALTSLRRFGLLRGCALTARRVVRCRPGGACGHDPVPRSSVVSRCVAVLAGVALAGVALPASAAVEVVRLDSADAHVSLSTHGGAIASVKLLNEQYHQPDREPEPGVPAERFKPGPLELVTTWDGAYLPLQLQLRRLQPDPSVRRVVRAGVEGTIERGSRGDLLLRLTTSSATWGADPRAGDLLFERGADAAKLEVAQTVAADLVALKPVGGTPAPEAGTRLKADFVREGSFSSVYASDSRYTKIQAPDGVVRMVWPDPTADGSQLFIERLYRHNGKYLMDHVVRFHWRGGEALKHQEDIVVFGWAGSKIEEPSMLNPVPDVIQPACGKGNSVEHADRELAGFTQHDATAWAGVEMRYFFIATALDEEGGAAPQCLLKVGPSALLTAILHPIGDRLLSPASATCRPAYLPGDGPTCEQLLERLGLDAFARPDDARRKKGDLSIDERKRLAALLEQDVRTVVFLGPKDLAALEDAGHNFESALDFGILSPISKPLLWLLQFFYGIVGQWGIAIFLLTVTVKLMLLYWTYKSFVSMREMQRLRPQMEALKERLGDDKAAIQRETMELFKRNKVNPLGGCLPMFIQMPIYIGLYRTVYATPDLFQAPLGLWIQDLSLPDPYFALPLILGVLMFIQQRLTPTTMDSQQQKIMMYMMPIMFCGFMLFLPSGLVFYILVNSVLSIAQQTYIYRQGDKKKAATAAPHH